MNTEKQVLHIENTSASNFLTEIANIIKNSLPDSKGSNEETLVYITRQQVADIFGVTLPTVHAWTNSGILKAYKIANKTRYIKAEVLLACKPQIHSK